MAHLTENYREKRVFKRPSTHASVFVSSNLAPLPEWTDHVVENRTITPVPQPEGELKKFVDALLAKDDAQVRCWEWG